MEPTEFTDEDRRRFADLCEELRQARANQDVARGVSVLKHMSEISPVLSQLMAAGLLDAGIASLATRIATGDPEAVRLGHEVLNKAAKENPQ